MKNSILIFSIIILSQVNINAQNINWQSVNEEQKTFAYINFGYDFGVTVRLGLAHKLKTSRPILLSIDYASPMGNDVVDDFKIRMGGQISIFEKSNFVASAKMYGVFRRHNTNLVQMSSFGSDFGTVMGYYKERWHMAAEFGFDKSIVTHLKHPQLIKEDYPAIVDGWFIPSGGHFYYGIQGSKTIGKNVQLSLRVGATNAQFDDKDALLPVYMQLGLVWNISKIKSEN